MSRNLRLKRGTAQQNNAYIGAAGEVTIDLDANSLRIHDGFTIGGHKTIKLSDVSSLLASAFMDHSISSDHDELYYRKEAVDTIVNNIIENGIDFDAQNTPLLINNTTFGWRDIVSEIRVRGTGNANPTWRVFRNGINGFQFDSGKMTECWATFHVDHDYAMGTKVYPHIHWSPNTTSTGTVRWGIEYHVAKGHQQGAGSTFGPTSIVYVTTNITQNSRFQHFVTEVSEVQAIPATLLEPDSLINIRFFRDSLNDTFPNPVFAFTVDIHYQTERLATLNKSPNFFE